MSIDTTVTIAIEDKGSVVENSCVLPDPLNLTIVRLDIKRGAESRYRLRLGDGVEGRLSVSREPHYQISKLHRKRSIYVLHKGWIAILVQKDTGMQVQIAFANSSDHFFVEAPANLWYAAYLSKDVVFTYSSSDSATGQTREYTQELPDEQALLALYANQEGLALDTVKSYVADSYGG